MTTTWPPRWEGPHFKTRGSRKVARGLKRRKAANVEAAHKTRVRFRDGHCRFPLCGCKAFGLPLHVSHQRHKGIGGNPAGDRSLEPLMVLLCSARHRENQVSIDAGSLRWRALTAAGADGPVAWDLDERVLVKAPDLARRPKWLELARETSRHVCEPFTPRQRQILELLRGMQL